MALGLTTVFYRGLLADDGQDFVTVAPCELAGHPHRYSGRNVRIEIEVVGDPRWPSVRPSECGDTDAIALSIPAGPPVEPRPNFDLIRDDEFDRLFMSISVLVPGPGLTRGRLTATVEGRFDSIRRGPLGWWRGYGHQRLFKKRLVLHRVIAVHVQAPVPERQ